MFDLHMHTTFSDGKNTPEEMVQEAIRRGLETVGISDHSSGDPVGMTLETSVVYRTEIARLKKKYAGQIKLLCGIEQDIFADAPAFDLDYIIGSVHYVETADGFLSIDHRPEKTQMIAEKYFGGDNYALAEAYFDTVAEVVSRTDCDIVGLMVSLDRMEVGQEGKISALQEIKQKYGFPTHAIVSMKEVTDYLYNRPIDGKVVIDDKIKKSMDAYYAEYGVK